MSVSGMDFVLVANTFGAAKNTFSFKLTSSHTSLDSPLKHLLEACPKALQHSKNGLGHAYFTMVGRY